MDEPQILCSMQIPDTSHLISQGSVDETSSEARAIEIKKKKKKDIHIHLEGPRNRVVNVR